MAKLGAYYGLCPLIDHRSLLGINSDAEAGNVIVTLGKNIATKYKLSDQKQLHSWRTRDKFTSPVIYDSESGKYVAVFNQTYIKQWNGDEDDIDKLKKFKFKQPIHTLVQFSEKSFIVFKNGAILLLGEALYNRKELVPEDVISESSEFLMDVLTSKIKSVEYVGLLIKTNECVCFTYRTFGSDDASYDTIQLGRVNVQLMGCSLHSNNRDSVKLFTFWSDGKLFSHPLRGELQTPDNKSEIYAVIESISCKHPVTMTALNENYLAMYGASCNEEGATVIIFNMQFKITPSRQVFKMFTEGARLWQIENHLLLCVGQHLAVVPFKLDVEELAALVGSHKAAVSTEDDDVTFVNSLEITSWQTNATDKLSRNVPKSIKSYIDEFSIQGWPENLICEQLIPSLLEKDNVQVISDSLEYFQDFPEKMLVLVLKYTLRDGSQLFGTNRDKKRCSLLDRLLSKSFCNNNLLPYLRCELELDGVILILRYLHYLLSNGVNLHQMNEVESENQVINWTAAILDANYQKVLLSKDSEVIEILTKLLAEVDSHLSCLSDLRSISPLLTQIKKGKPLNNEDLSHLKYSVEQIRLY